MKHIYKVVICISCVVLLIACSSEKKEFVVDADKIADGFVGYLYWNDWLYGIRSGSIESHLVGEKIGTVHQVGNGLKKNGDVVYPRVHREMEIKAGDSIYSMRSSEGNEMDEEYGVVIETKKGYLSVSFLRKK
ncbi:hypothetical protein NQ117_20615 [Paenibacillus sp. SC116]|uniref:hypothetical protein n=1 Tax=Paenibacillus sp. SC116 TaxID=2968986 RepID=UPI00215A51E8|nr:hypothetical protein [Paenibacillus sp. SC116]MCR8846088.1 hypothetical protein [Paenibacillus sp. SC116]